MNDSSSKNPQGEPLDIEDFDLDDLDEDESLGDEAWKDSGGAQATPAGRGASNRSFVQKYFYVLVAGVVVIFGALLAFGMMGGGPSPEQPQDTAASDMPGPPDDQALSAGPDSTELSGDSDMPPMPAPINAVPEEDLETPQTAARDGAQTGADGILTPMPDEVQPVETQPDQAEIPEPNLSELPLPAGEDQIKAETPSQPPSDNTEGLEIVATEAPIEPSAPPAQENVEKSLPAVISELDSTDAAPANSVTQDRVDQKISMLESRIELTDEKIDRLSSSLESLEKRLGDLVEIQEKRVALAQQEASAPPPAPKKPKNLIPEKPSAETVQKKAQPKKEPASAKTEWVLRAAQPGRAIVAAKGSNELITLEVGSKLKGLGRVSAISMLNGRWVVQGTEGMISQ
jgi:hypothetical protein